MTDHDSLHDDKHNSVVPTQAELYDSLRRIGELEDQKQSVQAEIDRRTNELRLALQHIDHDSLLFRMLATALDSHAPTQTVAGSATSSKRRTSRRSSRKNAAAKARA